MSFSLQLVADLIEVEPGATQPATIVVTSRATEGAQYELEVEGIDAEWKAVPVPVFTVEAGETHSEKLFFKPPRTTDSIAGSYPFVIRVRSLETGEARTVQGVLKVRPFHYLTMEVDPKKGTYTSLVKKNSYSLSLVNLGNTNHTLKLSGSDPEDSCTYDFEQDNVTLAPGQEREVEVVVTPRQTRFFGSARLVGFAITGRSNETPSAVATGQGQLEIRSVISPSFVGIAFLLALLVAAWAVMMPKPPSVSLSVSPMQVKLGEPVTVRWQATDASRVKVTVGTDVVYEGDQLDHEISVPTNEAGAVTVVAIASRNGRESAPYSQTVEVQAPVSAPMPGIISFSASGARVKLGTSLVFKWRVDPNVTKVAITPVKDELDPALMEYGVTPTQTGFQEYTLVAYNAEGKSVRSKPIKIEVYEESDASILALTATPNPVLQELGVCTISWQVTGSARVELGPKGGPLVAVDSVGSKEVPILAKTMYELVAYDEKGRTVKREIEIRFKKAEIQVPPIEDPTTLPPPTSDPAGVPPPLSSGTGLF